jgi:membrane AbrB-like protein
VAWALLMGYGFYRYLWWRHGADATLARATAFFAGSIGGASEMALQAERHGGRVDLVAAGHSLRVMLVVVAIPFALKATGVHGADLVLPGVTEVRPLGLAALVGVTLAAVRVFDRLRFPNPWVLGALLVTMLVTALGAQWSALPRAVTNAGQLFIGVALGTRFTPEFARSAPRWIATVTVGTLGMMGASALFGVALAALIGQHPATMVLATSPGGIAEMSITAKVLQLGVPVVTAFHVVRYLAVLVLTPVMFRWELLRLSR